MVFKIERLELLFHLLPFFLQLIGLSLQRGLADHSFIKQLIVQFQSLGQLGGLLARPKHLILVSAQLWVDLENQLLLVHMMRAKNLVAFGTCGWLLDLIYLKLRPLEAVGATKFVNELLNLRRWT